MKYKCEILGLIINVEAKYPLLKKRLSKYLTTSDEEALFTVRPSKKEVDEYVKNNPDVDKEVVEYMFTGKYFFNKCLRYDAFLLHASAVCVDNKAYVFSAPSGTGKSTHTSLYLKTFENSFLINDDKPVLRCQNDEFFVYGSPWSGKNDLSENVGVPLGGVCFLRRGNNQITELSTIRAFVEIVSQTELPKDKKTYDMFHETLNTILRKYNFYIAEVDMSEEAVKMTYNKLSQEGKK